MVVVLACCTGHVLCRLADSGRKPSPASAWWSDDDVPDVVLPRRGVTFGASSGRTRSLGENLVQILDERWRRLSASFPCLRHHLLRPGLVRSNLAPLPTAAPSGIGISATRQARRVLSASRHGGCLPTKDLGSFLVCRVRLAVDHSGWCCLATTSAVRDIVGTTALAATAPGGDLACSGSW
jgi:hypothetical protein